MSGDVFSGIHEALADDIPIEILDKGIQVFASVDAVVNHISVFVNVENEYRHYVSR